MSKLNSKAKRRNLGIILGLPNMPTNLPRSSHYQPRSRLPYSPNSRRANYSRK